VVSPLAPGPLPADPRALDGRPRGRGDPARLARGLVGACSAARPARAPDRLGRRHLLHPRARLRGPPHPAHHRSALLGLPRAARGAVLHVLQHGRGGAHRSQGREDRHAPLRDPRRTPAHERPRSAGLAGLDQLRPRGLARQAVRALSQHRHHPDRLGGGRLASRGQPGGRPALLRLHHPRGRERAGARRGSRGGHARRAARPADRR
jgi:hypothetical protein